MRTEITEDKSRKLSLRSSLIVTGFSLLYLLLSAAFIGYKTDQLFLVLLFNILYYLSEGSRNFILGFLIFIVFWIIFDSMKIFPNYLVNEIHIRDLYETERSIFGIKDQGNILTPNEFAQRHAFTFLDVLTGFIYLNWMPIPLLFAFYLFRKNRRQFLQFALAFLFVNLLGFMLYYAFPAAPPWYVQKYGFDIQFNTPGNTAGLARFDDFFGIRLFHNLYAKSSNVFAAMPSLHSAYPVVVLYFGLKNRLGLINVFFALFMAGTWFSAVYSGHHYILDVLGGISCAVTGLFLFEKLLLKTKGFNTFLRRYEKLIS